MVRFLGLPAGVEGLLASRGDAPAVRECISAVGTIVATELRSQFNVGHGLSAFQQQQLQQINLPPFSSPSSSPSSSPRTCDSGAAVGAALRFTGRNLPDDYNCDHLNSASSIWPSGQVSSKRRRVQGCLCCFEDESTASSRVRPSEDQQVLRQPYGSAASSMPDRWDVIGLGQAMVDFSAIVEDSVLDNLGLVKGTRKVVNHEERGKVLQALDGCSYKLRAGGSLSNTLVALARLGTGYNGELPLNVAMTGSVGSDPLGHFYKTKLSKANVRFLSEPVTDGTTGTVIVCTTPDAQRTMLSYQGMSSIINFDEAMEQQLSMSKVLVVEGYLWELSETVETIARACKRAREQCKLVALTASDMSCVKNHRDRMWDVMAESADILFTNADEARALIGCDNMSPASAAKLLSRNCPLVSVTDGAQGSYIGWKGEVSYIKPAACHPLDTCGAGDAYAAGLLYGFLRGVSDIKVIGNLAARVAAVVVGQQGTHLKEADAEALAISVPVVPVLEGLNLSRVQAFI